MKNESPRCSLRIEKDGRGATWFAFDDITGHMYPQNVTCARKITCISEINAQNTFRKES